MNNDSLERFLHTIGLIFFIVAGLGVILYNGFVFIWLESTHVNSIQKISAGSEAWSGGEVAAYAQTALGIVIGVLIIFFSVKRFNEISKSS